jgi:hypothetical protein
MIALSIRQPWASWIITGAAGRFKDLENREWRTPYRGRVLIHASKGGTQRDFAATVLGVNEALGLDLQLGFNDVARGGIIGSVEVYGCVEASDSAWFTGPFGFLLRDPQPTPFVAMPGRLSFFNVTEAALRGETGAIA